jgi:Amt family ammonium transporter
MTWHPDGIFFKMGVLDFAGGTVVHMSAGWAALAGAIFLGKEKYKSKSCSYQFMFY